MIDFNDAVEVEQIRRRRGESGCEIIAEELWQDEYSGAAANKPEMVSTRAANACIRHRRFTCQGTIWIIMGLPHVGKHSLFNALKDECLSRNKTAGFFTTLQVKPNGQLAKRVHLHADSTITKEMYTKMQRNLAFSGVFTHNLVSHVVPLEVISFLCGSAPGGCVVLLGPPALYHCVRESLPCVGVGVLHVVCSEEAVETRWKTQLIAANQSSGSQGSLSQPASSASNTPISSRPSSAGAQSDAGLANQPTLSSSVLGEGLFAPTFETNVGRQRKEGSVCGSIGMRGKSGAQHSIMQSDPFQFMGKASRSESTFTEEMAAIPSTVIDVINNEKSLGHAVAEVLETLFGDDL